MFITFPELPSITVRKSLTNHEFVVNGYEFVVNGYEFVVNGYEFVVNGYEFVPSEIVLLSDF